MILKIRKLLGLDKVYKASKHTEEEIKQTIESVYPKGFSEVVRKIKPTLVGMLKNNAYGLAKWGNYTHKSRLKLLMFNNR